jgi:hypothetical protein
VAWQELKSVEAAKQGGIAQWQEDVNRRAQQAIRFMAQADGDSRPASTSQGDERAGGAAQASGQGKQGEVADWRFAVK